MVRVIITSKFKRTFETWRLILMNITVNPLAKEKRQITCCTSQGIRHVSVQVCVCVCVCVCVVCVFSDQVFHLHVVFSVFCSAFDSLSYHTVNIEHNTVKS